MLQVRARGHLHHARESSRHEAVVP
jgi:hypothetical protein